jgi:hypothetical protein
MVPFSRGALAQDDVEHFHRNGSPLEKMSRAVRGSS